MLAREVISRVQRARKDALLAFDDRIAVVWDCEGVLAEAIEEHSDVIQRETLAMQMTRGGDAEPHRADAEVEGTALSLSIRAI